MESYTFKCIPLLLKLTMEDEFLSETSVAYEKILNEAAKDGWKFVRIDTISSENQEETYLNNISTTEKLCTKVFIFKKKISSKKKEEYIIDELICPSCKSEISEEDIYCENCATKLK